MTSDLEAVRIRSALPRIPAALAVTSLVVLASSYVVNAMDRQVFPVVLPQASKQLGFTLAQGGLLATIFTLGIGLSGLPTGFVIDKLTRKTTMLLGIAIYSAFTLLTGLAVGFLDLFAYRALSGVGEAMQNAALFSAVGAYFFTNRAVAIGSLNFAYGVGGFIGPTLGADLAASYGDWRAPFYVYGVVGLVFIVVIGVFISRRFTEQVEIADAKAAPVLTNEAAPLKLLNRNTVLLGGTAVIVGIAMYGFIGLYPSFLQSQLHISLHDAGVVASMFGLGAMMGLPAGYLMDRFNLRYVLIGAMLSGSVVGYLIFNGPTTIGWHYVLSFAEGAIASGFCFVGVYAGLQRSVHPDAIGRVSGFYVTCFYVPASIAGYLFSILVGAAGWGAAGLWQLTVLPVIGVVMLLFVDTERFAQPAVPGS